MLTLLVFLSMVSSCRTVTSVSATDVVRCEFQCIEEYGLDKVLVVQRLSSHAKYCSCESGEKFDFSEMWENETKMDLRYRQLYEKAL
jgi:hypothetical protein